jgi:hypothetical protein
VAEARRHRVRLGVELGVLKSPWEAHCRRTGTTPSEAIRLLVSQTLGVATFPAGGAGPLDHQASRHRIEIRLTQGEYIAMQDVASTAGFSVNRWIVAMIRAQLSFEPQLGEQELRVLAASNSQLAAIGRNLNQIARALNAGDRVEPYRFKVLETLKHEIDGHLDRVNQMIQANVDRWGRG